MHVYRITKRKYKADLSGRGAELFGGRWNPIGVPALYTAENRALCALELLAHLPKETLPPKYIIQTIFIPDKFETNIQKFEIEDLNQIWDTLHNEPWTEDLGRKNFQDLDKLGIKVPSAIIKQEFNIVLNPLHTLYKNIKVIEEIDFYIDERLIK